MTNNLDASTAGIKGDNLPLANDVEFKARLEEHAQEIERLQSVAILQTAAHVRQINDLFKYQRAEGGFVGYMKQRLGCSSSTAYRYLDVDKRFGSDPNVSQIWETLPCSALYLLAAPATPDKAINVIAKHIKAGKKLSFTEVKVIVADAKRAEAKHAKVNIKPTKTEPAKANHETNGIVGNGGAIDDTQQSADRMKAHFAEADPAVPGDFNIGKECGDHHDGDGAAGDHGHDHLGDEPKVEPAPAATPAETPARNDLLEDWQIGTAEERLAVLKYEGAAGLIGLLKNDPELLGDLVDRVMGQTVRTASQTTTFAKQSTGRLRTARHIAKKLDLDRSELDREAVGLMVGSLRAIDRDAEKRGIADSNVVVAEGKANNPRSKK